MRYDLEAVAKAVDREGIVTRAPNMWPYRELLPVERDENVVSLGEAALLGANTFLVDGLITDCAAVVHEDREGRDWFDLSTLKEPYRLEGKKTMGLELAKQLGWKLPDVIRYLTGGGTGLIGMWKAFDELEQLGWLEVTDRPRMISCQASGSAPIARAFAAGDRFATPIEDAQTLASGLRVPGAVGDFLILDAVHASGGQARHVSDARILSWMQRASALEGISFAPETAACLGVLEDLLAEGAVEPDE